MPTVPPPPTRVFTAPPRGRRRPVAPQPRDEPKPVEPVAQEPAPKKS